MTPLGMYAVKSSNVNSLKFVVVVVVMGLFIISQRGVLLADEGTKPARPEAVTQALIEAARLQDEGQEESEAFIRLLQDNVDYFQRVPTYVSSTNTEVLFESVWLNKDGAGFDAVKFVIDEYLEQPQQEYEFWWWFVFGAPIDISWHIAPAKGNLGEVYSDRRQYKNKAHTDPEIPDRNLTVYQSLRDPLKPGTYILWFRFRDDGPRPHRLFFDITVNKSKR